MGVASMKLSRIRKTAKLLVWFSLALGCQLWPINGLAGQDQQQSSGPKPNVDATVIAPKKTQPRPITQPENKPEKINPNEVYSISTSSTLVNLDVLVEDKDGNPITSLGRKNFKLYDDGVAQTI